METSIEKRSGQARLTTNFLRDQLEDAERELREQEYLIREFNEKYRGELPGELDSNLRKLDQLQQQRQSLAMQVTEAETRMAMLLASVDENSPEARLAALKSRLSEEVSVRTDEHPNVVSLRRQIRALEEQVEDTSSPFVNRSVLVAAERTAVDAIRKRQHAAEARIQEIDVRIANTPKRQEELNALAGKVVILRDNYAEFLSKVQDAELAENLETAQQGDRVVIMDRASPPAHPQRRRAKFLMMGIAASIGLALAIGIALELLDPVIVSSAQIDTTFGVPVLGSVWRIPERPIS
jgi:uncharacterized protein involved in exopolysaccharide biosynthesis